MFVSDLTACHAVGTGCSRYEATGAHGEFWGLRQFWGDLLMQVLECKVPGELGVIASLADIFCRGPAFNKEAKFHHLAHVLFNVTQVAHFLSLLLTLLSFCGGGRAREGLRDFLSFSLGSGGEYAPSARGNACAVVEVKFAAVAPTIAVLSRFSHVLSCTLCGMTWLPCADMRVAGQIDEARGQIMLRAGEGCVFQRLLPFTAFTESKARRVSFLLSLSSDVGFLSCRFLSDPH